MANKEGKKKKKERRGAGHGCTKHSDMSEQANQKHKGERDERGWGFGRRQLGCIGSDEGSKNIAERHHTQEVAAVILHVDAVDARDGHALDHNVHCGACLASNGRHHLVPH